MHLVNLSLCQVSPHTVDLYWYQEPGVSMHMYLVDLFSCHCQVSPCTCILLVCIDTRHHHTHCTLLTCIDARCQHAQCTLLTCIDTRHHHAQCTLLTSIYARCTMHLLITMYWYQVSACRVHLIELEPRHGVMQVMWEQQFFLATSPQLHHLQSDESLLRWFDERGTFISSSSASVGKICKAFTQAVCVGWSESSQLREFIDLSM